MRIVTTGLLALALLAAGCGSDSDSDLVSERPTETTTDVSVPTEPSAPNSTSTTLLSATSDAAQFTSGWERVTDVEAPGVPQSMVWLETNPRQGLVVVQVQQADSLYYESDEAMFDPENPSRFRSWSTSDGQAWTGEDQWELGWLNTVSATGAGYVGAGVDEQAAAPSLWQSSDGISWIAVPETTPPDLRKCEPLDVNYTCLISIQTNASSLMISGYDPAGELPDSSGAFSRGDLPGCAWWLSLNDGATWQRVQPPEDCLGIKPVSDGWVSTDSSGTLTATTNGSTWEPWGELPSAPFIWERSDDGRILATRGGQWLAVSLDDGRTWQVAGLPFEAEAELAVVLDDGFVVLAATADGAFNILHRTIDDTAWTHTPVGQAPLTEIADLQDFNGRLYAATYSGDLWAWAGEPAN